MGLITLKSPSFLFLPHVSYKKCIIPKTKHLKKYLQTPKRTEETHHGFLEVCSSWSVTSSARGFSHEWGACEALSSVCPSVSNSGWAHVAIFPSFRELQSPLMKGNWSLLLEIPDSRRFGWKRPTARKLIRRGSLETDLLGERRESRGSHTLRKPSWKPDGTSVKLSTCSRTFPNHIYEQEAEKKIVGKNTFPGQKPCM